MKKKIIGIFFLICLIAPFIGTYSWLQYRIKYVRKQVEKQIITGIDKNKLVLLKFTRAAVQTKLSWEHSNEFEFNGSMYDVIETETKGDTIFYWCLPDSEETKLNRQLKNLLVNALQKDKQNKEKQEHLVIFCKSLFYSKIFQWKAFFDSEMLSMTRPFFYYSSLFFSPPVPPP